MKDEFGKRFHRDEEEYFFDNTHNLVACRSQSGIWYFIDGEWQQHTDLITYFIAAYYGYDDDYDVDDDTLTKISFDEAQQIIAKQKEAKPQKQSNPKYYLFRRGHYDMLARFDASKKGVYTLNFFKNGEWQVDLDAAKDFWKEHTYRLSKTFFKLNEKQAMHVINLMSKCKTLDDEIDNYFFDKDRGLIVEEWVTNDSYMIYLYQFGKQVAPNEKFYFDRIIQNNLPKMTAEEATDFILADREYFIDEKYDRLVKTWVKDDERFFSSYECIDGVDKWVINELFNQDFYPRWKALFGDRQENYQEIDGDLANECIDASGELNGWLYKQKMQERNQIYRLSQDEMLDLLYNEPVYYYDEIHELVLREVLVDGVYKIETYRDGNWVEDKNESIFFLKYDGNLGISKTTKEFAFAWFEQDKQSKG